MVVVWSKRAARELLQAYKYIYCDSPQNAAKVRDAIIKMTILLSKNPEPILWINTKKVMMAIGVHLKNIDTEYLTGF